VQLDLPSLTRSEIVFFAGEKPPQDIAKFDARKTSSFGLADTALSLFLQSLRAKVRAEHPDFKIASKDWVKATLVSDFIKTVQNRAGAA
jgi:hypothetical protein